MALQSTNRTGLGGVRVSDQQCCATLGVHTATTFAMATEIGAGRASDERLMFTVSA